MVLFRCSVESSWLKSFLRLYGSFNDECYLLFTEEHIEGKMMDPSRIKALSFRIFPLGYYARDRPSRKWILCSAENFIKAIRRYKKGEMVPLEVRDDGAFWVGGVQIGNEAEEAPGEFPTPQITKDGTLRVAVQPFKRIVDSVTGFNYVGFKIEGREGVMGFFEDEETFKTVEIKPYVEWLLEIEGKVLCAYRLENFKMLLVLGLSDTAKISFMNQAICQATYTGDFFDIDMWIAPYEAWDTFRVILEKKPPARRLVFVLEKAEIELFRGMLRSVNAAFRGEEVWLGVNPVYGLFFYWKFYDQGYFKVPKSVFREFWDVGSLAGSFNLSGLAAWLRGVENFECYLEGEPPTSMVLVGKGESIAPKEVRSDGVNPLDVPAITPAEVFRGPREVLAEVFADAVAAGDDFLVFIMSSYELKVIGQDTIYYRASLPLNGFKVVVEEDYVPISNRLLKPLGEFFKAFPGHMVSIGRPETSYEVYVGGETALGEFKAMFAQTTENVARAIDAYKEETKPPAPPKPKEVKPLAPPPIEYVKVLILKAIPQFVGADMKVYGPYYAGQIQSMPKGNAELLVKQGVATYELAPPVVKVRTYEDLKREFEGKDLVDALAIYVSRYQFLKRDYLLEDLNRYLRDLRGKLTNEDLYRFYKVYPNLRTDFVSIASLIGWIPLPPPPPSVPEIVKIAEEAIKELEMI